MSDFTGIYRGSVFDIEDPERRGRLRLLVPQILGESPSAWAEPTLVPAEGYEPAVDDRVWVQFEGGDVNSPTYHSRQEVQYADLEPAFQADYEGTSSTAVQALQDAADALTAAGDLAGAVDAAQDAADAALTLAGTASTSANNKNAVYWGPTAPAPPSGLSHNVDDIWFNTSQGYTINVWDGDSWEPRPMGHQAIATLDLGKATVGELDGVYIKANTIAVQSLLVSSFDNMLNDPTFVRPIGQTWQSQSWSSISVGGGRRAGTNALMITNTAAANQVFNLPLDMNKIEAGEAIRIDVPFVSSVSHAANLVSAWVQFRLTSGATVTQPVQGPAATANTWTTLGGSLTVPANTVSWSFFVQTAAGLSTGTTKFDTPKVVRAADGRLLVDGAIDGKTITGPLLRTASSGARIELEGENLGGYTGGSLKWITPSNQTVSLFYTNGVGGGIPAARWEGSDGALTGNIPYVELGSVGRGGSSISLRADEIYIDRYSGGPIDFNQVNTTGIRIGNMSNRTSVLHAASITFPTTDANGDTTWDHNLFMGSATYQAFVQSRLNGAVRVFNVTEKNNNNIKVNVKNAAGNNVTSTSGITADVIIVG